MYLFSSEKTPAAYKISSNSMVLCYPGIILSFAMSTVDDVFIVSDQQIRQKHPKTSQITHLLMMKIN